MAIGLGMVLKEWHPVKEQLRFFDFPFTGGQQLFRTGRIPSMSSIFSTVGAVFK
jgi:hypothetical protein